MKSGDRPGAEEIRRGEGMQRDPLRNRQALSQHRAINCFGGCPERATHPLVKRCSVRPFGALGHTGRRHVALTSHGINRHDAPREQ